MTSDDLGGVLVLAFIGWVIVRVLATRRENREYDDYLHSRGMTHQELVDEVRRQDQGIPPETPSEGPSPMTPPAVDQPRLLDLDDFELIRQWRDELWQSIQIVKSFTRSPAVARALHRFAHIPMSRRLAETGVFFMWWADKFVSEQIADPRRAKLACDVLRGGVSEDFPEMDLIGQARYTQLSGLLEKGEGIMSMSAVPLRAMDASVSDEQAVAALASFQCALLEKLHGVWS